MPLPKWPYPKATVNRLDLFDPEMVKIRHKCVKASAQNFLLLQGLFLALFSYVFGSLYLQTTHVHNLTIVFVDYDGGAIGQAWRDAYSGLAGPGFPTLVEQPPSAYAAPSDLYESVCHINYWAAVYTSPGASGRLQDALRGSSAAAGYDGNGAVSYIWNEARYPTVQDSAVAGSIETLSEAARVAYSSPNGTGNVSITALAAAGPSALSVLVEPWTLAVENIQSTPQGSRTIYNTIVIILIMIQEFFYLGTINGLYANFKIFLRAKPHFIILIRNTNSLLYTFVGSMCTAGAVWAFKDGWNVNGAQYVMTWMTLWLFAHLNFMTLDCFTVWLDAPYVPMALITWIVLNVTSIILPFEVSPAFYKFGYLFPAHSVYATVGDIWSFGCNPQLEWSLPVLFAWEIVSFVISSLGVYRRAHYATLGEEAKQREFKERLDGAVQFEMQKVHEARAKAKHGADVEKTDTTSSSVGKVPSDETAGEERDVEEADVRDELSEMISEQNQRDARDQRRLAVCNFGPQFAVPFGHDDSSSDGKA